jgi:TonB family protein
MNRRVVACIAAVIAAACGSNNEPLAPSPSPPAPIVISSNVTEPVKIKTVDPIYPAEARQKGISGQVILEAVIDETGHVRSVRVLKSVDPLLDKAAADAVWQWEYTPARQDGQPVPVIMTITVNFVLQ